MSHITMGVFIFAQLISLPSFNIYKLADAIYQTEGSYATSWPSGTINHFKHDTTRQECLSIIIRQAKLWDGSGNFIDFLAQTYNPLNLSWSKSVKYFYSR